MSIDPQPESNDTENSQILPSVLKSGIDDRMDSHPGKSATDEVGDTRASDSESTAANRTGKESPLEKEPPPLPHNQDEKWGKALEQLRQMATQSYQELKIIRTKLNKLDKIELSTEALAEQMSGVLQCTTTLEGVSSSNSEAIAGLKEEIKSLRSTIASQEETISDLKDLKKEVSEIKADFMKTSQEKVQEFSNLIGIQQKQVDLFHDTNRKIQDVIQDNVTQHVDEMGKLEEAVNYKSLKDQASRNINNLVIIGLEEDSKISPLLLQLKTLSPLLLA